MASTLLDPEHCPPNHSSGGSTAGTEDSRGGEIGDIELWQCVLALRTAPVRAEEVGPAGRGGGSPGRPLAPGLPGRAQAGVRRGGGPLSPRAAVERFRANLRQGTALSGPRHPRTAVWCLRVHVPVTLESPGRESLEGTGGPYPTPGLLFLAPRSGPGNVREPRSPCPGSRSPGRCPLSTDAQIRPSPRWSPFPVTVPFSGLPSRSAYSGACAPELQSWGSRSRSRPPQAQGPERNGEKLSPRGWA